MKRSELLSRLLIASGLLLFLTVPLIARKAAAQGAIEVHARMATDGGWTPEVIQAQAGVPLHLRLTSDDVTHGFAVGQSGQPGVDVLPGKMTDLTLTFDKPGTYTYYCTRWCGSDHWRMRGTIQVSGSDPEPPQAISSPLYSQLGLDIDAAHPAETVPDNVPSAHRGSAFKVLIPARYLTTDYYRGHSPAQVFEELHAESALPDLTDASRWDLIAYIWQTNSSPENASNGQKLYAQNCAACHGETGQGNGVLAPTPENLLYPQIGRLDMSPAWGGHTAFPILGISVPHWAPGVPGRTRDFVLLVSESLRNKCQEVRQLSFMVDVTTERTPFSVATFEVPDPTGDFCRRGGRFGPHSSNESFSPIYYGRLVFIAYFNGGVRAVDVRDPFHPTEAAFYIPSVTAKTDKRCVVRLSPEFFNISAALQCSLFFMIKNLT